jgi:hypothetical protein
MKTRVINKQPNGNYTDDFILDNFDKIINGQLVSEWELADLYNKDFINPFWNGTEWVESATSEEIEAHQRSLIPQTAKNMKFRLALIKVGISINAINQAINAMPESPQKEQIQTLWDFADFFERTDATLISMAQILGITNEQLDNFFIISNQ